MGRWSNIRVPWGYDKWRSYDAQRGEFEEWEAELEQAVASVPGGASSNGAPASAHYARLSPEPIDVIESWGLSFRLANALKYISRAGRKDPTRTIEDLEKCIAYVRREVNWLKGTPGWR
jgi:hypothetical protein